MKQANQHKHIQRQFLLTEGYVTKSFKEPRFTLLSVLSHFKFLKFEIGILFHLQATVIILMASSFLPFDKSHLGDSGSKYQSDIKGTAERPMKSSRCLMLGIE